MQRNLVLQKGALARGARKASLGKNTLSICEVGVGMPEKQMSENRGAVCGAGIFLD